MPSPRVQHENARYYERCRAADLDPERTSTERHDCWVAWLEYYTRGESVERVQHARARVAALETDGDAATLPGLPDVVPMPEPGRGEVPEQPGDSGGETRLRDVPAPDSATTRERYRPPAPSAAETPCTPMCTEGFNECVVPCDARGEHCYDSCRAQFRTCVAAC